MSLQYEVIVGAIKFDNGIATTGVPSIMFLSGNSMKMTF